MRERRIYTAYLGGLETLYHLGPENPWCYVVSTSLGQKTGQHMQHKHQGASPRFPGNQVNGVEIDILSKTSVTCSSLRTRRSSIAVVCVIFTANTDEHLESMLNVGDHMVHSRTHRRARKLYTLKSRALPMISLASCKNRPQT